MTNNELRSILIDHLETLRTQRAIWAAAIIDKTPRHPSKDDTASLTLSIARQSHVPRLASPTRTAALQKTL